jgi:hypothetical protein
VGKFLWTQHTTFVFHKGRTPSWPGERQSAFARRLYSM